MSFDETFYKNLFDFSCCSDGTGNDRSRRWLPFRGKTGAACQEILSYTAPSLSRSHGQNKDSNSGDSSEYTYDSAIRRLELDVNYASVTIGTSEDDHISVKARNAGKYFKETVEDGDMLVLEDERPKGKATLELEILLPDRVLEEMELDLGAAELTADPASRRGSFP